MSVHQAVEEVDSQRIKLKFLLQTVVSNKVLEVADVVFQFILSIWTYALTLMAQIVRLVVDVYFILLAFSIMFDFPIFNIHFSVPEALVQIKESLQNLALLVYQFKIEIHIPWIDIRLFLNIDLSAFIVALLDIITEMAKFVPSFDRIFGWLSAILPFGASSCPGAGSALVLLTSLLMVLFLALLFQTNWIAKYDLQVVFPLLLSLYFTRLRYTLNKIVTSISSY